MSNIIPFPVKKKVEEVDDEIVEQYNNIEEAETDWDFIMSSISGSIPQKYFANTDENGDFLDDMMFIGEALKSAIYRFHKLKHPIQKLVDENIVYDDQGEMEFFFDSK